MKYLVTFTFKDYGSKSSSVNSGWNSNVLDYISSGGSITLIVPSFNLEFLHGFWLPYSEIGVSQPKVFISEFYWYRMVIRLNSLLNYSNCGDNLEVFNFIPNCYTDCSVFFHIYLSFLSSRLCQVILLVTIVWLMRKITTILCNEYVETAFISLLNLIYKVEDDSVKKRHFFSFVDLYNCIVNRTAWICKCIYNLSYKKLYYDILYLIYTNLKRFMHRIYFSLNLPVKKSTYLTQKIYFVLNLGIINLSNINLNIIYSTITIVYIVLGWLIDYLSFTWLLGSKSMSYDNKFKWIFWIKHFIYALVYIVWIYLGVFSTNGIYLLILGRIGTIRGFNTIIIVIGSLVSYVGSNLWYFYAKVLSPKSFNLIEVFILPVLSKYYRAKPHTNKGIGNSLLHRLFYPEFFNLYTSLRRSIFEWVAFTGMVFSTYGSWNFYENYVFSHLSIISNLSIWVGPSLISGFVLLYIEEVRPRGGHFLYGFFYLLFWTSMCFLTNTIVIGYFNVDNAIHGLFYFVPINFLLGIIYSVPLYRGSVTLTMIKRFLHLTFFILLIGITLISAGLLWYIIGS